MNASTRRLLAAALAGSAPIAAFAFNPQPEPPGFGMFGVTKAQVVRVTLVNAAAAIDGTESTCKVRLGMIDPRGVTVKYLGLSTRDSVALAPGKVISLTMLGNDVRLPHDGYGRAYLRASLTATAAEDDCDIHTSVEVFDATSGATGFLQNPGVTHGFNPQPEPPGSTRN